MTNPTTDLLRVVELVQSVIAAEGNMHQPPRVEAAKEAAFALVREHGRTLLEAMRDAERYRALRELLRRDPAAPWTPQELAAFRITQWVTGFRQETLDRALDAVIAARGAKENGHE